MSKNLDLIEWKKALNNVKRFDKILLDVRKYGFSFLSGLVTAQGFFGFSNSMPGLISIAVVIGTMVLVVMLYWLDTYYLTLLIGSWLRARFLEWFKLETVELAHYQAGLLSRSKSKNILHYLYIGFMISLLVLGLATYSVKAWSMYKNTETKNNTSFFSFISYILQGKGKETYLLCILMAGFTITMVAIYVTRIYLISPRNKTEEKILKVYNFYRDDISNLQGNDDEKARKKEELAQKLEKWLYQQLREYNHKETLKAVPKKEVDKYLSKDWKRIADLPDEQVLIEGDDKTNDSEY